VTRTPEVLGGLRQHVRRVGLTDSAIVIEFRGEGIAMRGCVLAPVEKEAVRFWTTVVA